MEKTITKKKKKKQRERRPETIFNSTWVKVELSFITSAITPGRETGRCNSALQLFREKDKGRLSHGGQPSLSAHLPLIASCHRQTHTHTHPGGEGRSAELSPPPKNFQHFAEFLDAAGGPSSEPGRWVGPRAAAAGRWPKPRGTPRWSCPPPARGDATPPGVGAQSGGVSPARPARSAGTMTPTAKRGAPRRRGSRVRSCWQGRGAPGGAGGVWGAPHPGSRRWMGGRQAGEIRSQFQAVPTERCYQDGTCRTEYFKALSGPPSGAGTGATALAAVGVGGEGGRGEGGGEGEGGEDGDRSRRPVAGTGPHRGSPGWGGKEVPGVWGGPRSTEGVA